MKAKSFDSVLCNYAALLETLHSIQNGSDGVSTCVKLVVFIRNSKHLHHGWWQVFSLTDSLTLALQGENVTNAEAKKAAAATCQSCFWSNEEFSRFWERAVAKAQELQLLDLCIGRPRRPPRHKFWLYSMFLQFNPTYFEVANTINGKMQRFEQKNYELYSTAEELLHCCWWM